MRKETDFLGEISLPDNALYGINSVRAKENFPYNSAFPIEWYKAMGDVKLACYLTYKDFKSAVKRNYKEEIINFFSEEILDYLIEAAKEVSEGKYFDNFIIPAVQGGAGTSINMNVNEIITNVALLKMGHKAGNYQIIDPIEHANIYQSTNDTVPTSLKVAVMVLLEELENKINELRFSLEAKEQKYRNALRIGYTQMQEAVPSSYGRLFSTYNEALGRDWWRISKCFERIKTVNLGGSAIGTSISVPRYFVMNVTKQLAQITKLPLAKAENLSDNTANTDSFVEIHSILKANAVNLEKMTSDLRLLASELCSKKEIKIPKKQIGSSIMPSKVNPVIVEFTVSAAHKIYANDVLISTLSALGNFELNPYLPQIGIALIESLKLLIAINRTVKVNLIDGLEVNTRQAEESLIKSPSITTALLPYVGYHKAAELAKFMRENDCNVFEANKKIGVIDNEKLKNILSVSNLLKNGFSVNDLL